MVESKPMNRPYDAKWQDDKPLPLRRDNFEFGDCWILTDGARVTMAEQKMGESPRQTITLPRETFNKLIDFYMRDQKPRLPEKGEP
jgi:hypothetical protein